MPSSQNTKRQAHAVIDLSSRQPKALKTERILDLQPSTTPLQIPEVGCGSGGIAHYFGTHPSLACEVHAVDVNDNRQVFDGYTYTPVSGVELPFADAQFDTVISNHVIEHVGDEAAQIKHLEEIGRILKPNSKAYLAVPNRWMLVEPHYRLAFLSWWPHAWRSPYLRLMGKGQFYDCEPLQLPQFERLLRQANLQFENKSVQAWRETFDIEKPQALATHFLRALPNALLQALQRIIPTLIYTIGHTK